MTGPVVVLLLALAVVPVMVLILRIDAYLTERRYQREQRGDESARYAAALAAVRRQQHLDPHHARIGHKPRKADR